MDTQAKRYIEDLNNLTKKQAAAIEQLHKLMIEKEKHTISLIPTVRKLIEHGLNHDEIVEITNISPDELDRFISENKRCQLPYIYLNDEESKEFDRLLGDIHRAIDIQELIDANRERERIKFIHRVLVRYQQEADMIPVENSENSGERIMHHLDSIVKNELAKSAYATLVRIFGNEIKRKREEVLIKIDR